MSADHQRLLFPKEEGVRPSVYLTDRTEYDLAIRRTVDSYTLNVEQERGRLTAADGTLWRGGHQ